MIYGFWPYVAPVPRNPRDPPVRTVLLCRFLAPVRSRLCHAPYIESIILENNDMHRLKVTSFLVITTAAMLVTTPLLAQRQQPTLVQLAQSAVAVRGDSLVLNASTTAVVLAEPEGTQSLVSALVDQLAARICVAQNSPVVPVVVGFWCSSDRDRWSREHQSQLHDRRTAGAACDNAQGGSRRQYLRNSSKKWGYYYHI